MVSCNKEEYMKKIWSIKDHGKNIDLVFEKNNDNKFKWLHENFGYNFRLTEMQSAIGRIQLKLLEEWNKIRNRNAEILIKDLSELKVIRIPLPPKNYKHAWYKFYVYLNLKCLKKDWFRERIISNIKEYGYPLFKVVAAKYILKKAFVNRGLAPEKRLPNAKNLGETSLMFLIHPTITKKQMYKYAEIIKKVLLKAQN